MPVTYSRKRKVRNAPRMRAQLGRARRRVRSTAIRRGGAHFFKEKAQLVDITAATGLTYGSQTYALSDLTNLPAFRSMFDLYKITGVKLLFVPVQNSADAGSTSTLPMLYIAPNRDPMTPAPTSIGDVLNDDGCKVIRLSKPVKFWLKNPKADLLTYDSEGNVDGRLPFQFNSSLNALQPWLATGGNGGKIDQSGIKHYGHRWVVDNPNTASISVHVFVTYYFAMKEQD